MRDRDRKRRSPRKPDFLREIKEPPRDEQAPAPDEQALSLETTREYIARSLRDLEAVRKKLEREGDTKAVLRAMRDEGERLRLLAMGDKGASADASLVHASRDEIELAMQRIRSMVDAVKDQPFLCEHCGREMRKRAGE